MALTKSTITRALFSCSVTTATLFSLISTNSGSGSLGPTLTFGRSDKETFLTPHEDGLPDMVMTTR